MRKSVLPGFQYWVYRGCSQAVTGKLRFWTFRLLEREDVHCAVLLLFFFPFENEVIIRRMQRNGEIFIFEKGFET